MGGLVLAPKLDSGVALDLEAVDLVLSGVHLGQQYVGIIGQFLGCFVEVGSQLLAVSAPGGIKFDQDLLRGVQDQFSETFADYHLHGFVVGLGHGSGFQKWLDLPSCHSLHKVGQAFSCDFLSNVSVFFQLSVQVKNRRSGLSTQSQIFRQSFVESVAVVFRRDRQNYIGIGGVVCGECGKGGGFGILITQKKEQGGLSFLENFLDCRIVKGQDFGLEQHQDSCEEKDELHCRLYISFQNLGLIQSVQRAIINPQKLIIHQNTSFSLFFAKIIVFCSLLSLKRNRIDKGGYFLL